MSVQGKINEWLRTVRGKVIGSEQRKVFTTVDHFAHYEEDILPPNVTVEPVLIIEIPLSELKDITYKQEWYKRNIGGFNFEKFDKIIEEHLRVKRLCKENPTINYAYEQYLSLVKLSDDKDIEDYRNF